jgi:hypothetical protein
MKWNWLLNYCRDSVGVIIVVVFGQRWMEYKVYHFSDPKQQYIFRIAYRNVFVEIRYNCHHISHRFYTDEDFTRRIHVPPGYDIQNGDIGPCTDYNSFEKLTMWDYCALYFRNHITVSIVACNQKVHVLTHSYLSRRTGRVRKSTKCSLLPLSGFLPSKK